MVHDIKVVRSPDALFLEVVALCMLCQMKSSRLIQSLGLDDHWWSQYKKFTLIRRREGGWMKVVPCNAVLQVIMQEKVNV